MPSYLGRYLAGEHEQVWAELTALGEAVRHEPPLSEAVLVANETMRRARHNIGILIPRFTGIGYQFGVVDDGSSLMEYPGPIQPPPPDIKTRLKKLEAVTGPVPLSLRA